MQISEHSNLGYRVQHEQPVSPGYTKLLQHVGGVPRPSASHRALCILWGVSIICVKCWHQRNHAQRRWHIDRHWEMVSEPDWQRRGSKQHRFWDSGNSAVGCGTLHFAVCLCHSYSGRVISQLCLNALHYNMARTHAVWRSPEGRVNRRLELEEAGS